MGSVTKCSEFHLLYSPLQLLYVCVFDGLFPTRKKHLLFRYERIEWVIKNEGRARNDIMTYHPQLILSFHQGREKEITVNRRIRVLYEQQNGIREGHDPDTRCEAGETIEITRYNGMSDLNISLMQKHEIRKDNSGLNQTPTKKMISQFFILSDRGDRLILKDCTWYFRPIPF